MTLPDATALRRLRLAVRRRAEGLAAGVHAGIELGPGSDAEELVAYRPGMDVRRIDWNATARTGDAHAWLTRAELAVDTWILVDRSASMAFGSTQHEKADVATWTAATFGLASAGVGDRVGLGLVEPAGVRWTAPTRGGRVAASVTRVAAIQRDGAAVPLADALSQLQRRAPRRGVRVVVSDLVDPDGRYARPFAWEESLAGLAARHDVIVVEVVDPRELELPDVGEVVLVDPESGSQRIVRTSDSRLRADFAAAAAAHRAATAEAVRSAHADHLVVRTDDDLVRSIVRFLSRRRRRPSRRPRSIR